MYLKEASPTRMSKPMSRDFIWRVLWRFTTLQIVEFSILWVVAIVCSNMFISPWKRSSPNKQLASLARTPRDSTYFEKHILVGQGSPAYDLFVVGTTLQNNRLIMLRQCYTSILAGRVDTLRSRHWCILCLWPSRPFTFWSKTCQYSQNILFSSGLPIWWMTRTDKSQIIKSNSCSALLAYIIFRCISALTAFLAAMQVTFPSWFH